MLQLCKSVRGNACRCATLIRAFSSLSVSIDTTATWLPIQLTRQSGIVSRYCTRPLPVNLIRACSTTADWVDCESNLPASTIRTGCLSNQPRAPYLCGTDCKNETWYRADIVDVIVGTRDLGGIMLDKRDESTRYEGWRIVWLDSEDASTSCSFLQMHGRSVDEISRRASLKLEPG